MSSLWTDLLLLHGHITDLKLAWRLWEKPAQPPREPSKPPSKGTRWLAWPARLCLGIGDGNLRTQ